MISFIPASKRAYGHLEANSVNHENDMQLPLVMFRLERF